ncbi:MAG: abortive infection family protein [Bacteroidota bacterium]
MEAGRNSEMKQLPDPLCEVAGEVLGDYYYNHSKIEALFMRANAPNPVPDGSCVAKATEWLRRCSMRARVDAHEVLGKVLESFMEVELRGKERASHEQRKERVLKMLGKYGLEYQVGGRISYTGPKGLSSRHLNSLLRDRDLNSLDVEFERAERLVESDPPVALNAATNIVEALLKVYIEDEGLTLPSAVTLKKLWGVVGKDLGQDPACVSEDALKKILSGQITTLDGLSQLRNSASSAHGRGRKSNRIDSRTARLAVNAAHTVVAWLIESWERKLAKTTNRSQTRPASVSSRHQKRLTSSARQN